MPAARAQASLELARIILGFPPGGTIDVLARRVADKLRVRISLETETRTHLKAENAVAVIPGRSDEVIILNAHVDGWFDGAGDNADGFAVLVALARHFAKPENRPERTLVFVASAGHHSPGMNGPRNFVAANPDLVKRAVMMVNIEHVAQRNFSPARSTAPDGYRQALAELVETNPRAADYRLADAVDDRFVREIEASGLERQLYGR